MAVELLSKTVLKNAAKSGRSLTSLLTGVLSDPRAGTLPGGVTFSRADATTCATYVDGSGLVTTVAANVLRAAHFVKSIQTVLLEAAATNLMPFGASFGDASWTKSNLTDNGAVLGPDGSGTNARSFTSSASFGLLQHTVTGLTAAQPYVVHYWIKSSTATPSIKIGTTEVASGVLTLTNGYQRFSISFTAAGTSTTVFIGANSSWPIGREVSLAFGGLEAGSAPTSTISNPTATLVTRAADSLVLPAVSGFQSQALTLYQRGFSLASSTWTDTAAPYTAGNTIAVPNGKAYSHPGTVFIGSLTVAQCRSMLGLS